MSQGLPHQGSTHKAQLEPHRSYRSLITPATFHFQPCEVLLCQSHKAKEE